MKKYKISIIGAGNVGASLCYGLVMKNLCSCISLIDVYEDIAKGKSIDITQASMLDKSCTITSSSDYEDIKNSDIVVITAGSPRKPGMSRDDLLLKNAGITKDIAKKVAKYAPKSIIIEVANPLDAMTYIALKESGFDKSRVIGMAGVLDSARMSYHISMELDFKPKEIKSLVIGTHGDKMVPLARFSTIDTKEISTLLSDEKIKNIVKKTKEGGAEIVSLLDTSAYYAPAFSILVMIEAIVNDLHTILPCATLLEGEYGYKDVVCGVPIKLGKKGVLGIEELDLNDLEKMAFKTSIESANSLIKTLKENPY